jgi:hypothetical protein
MRRKSGNQPTGLAPLGDQSRQACLRPQMTNIIQRALRRSGTQGGESFSKDRECDQTSEPRHRSELQLTVANCQSASRRLMKIPGQMLRMTFLAPRLEQRWESALPFVALAFPRLSGLQSSVAMALSDYFDQGRSPRVVGGCKQNPATLQLLGIQRSGRCESAIEVVLLRHRVVVQRRQVTRPEFLAPTVVKLGR